MAVPKSKVSKSRRDKRRANCKLEAPGMVECPKCHEMKLSHRICKNCGHYDGKEIIKDGKIADPATPEVKTEAAEPAAGTTEDSAK